MKNVLASLVFATSSMALAGTSQLIIDGRVDHASFAPNDASGKVGYEAFQVNRLKLDFIGKVGEQNTVRVRLDGKPANTTQYLRDNTNPGMDLAYINHKFTPEFSATMGRFHVGMGGLEESIVNLGDVYLNTTAGLEITKVYIQGGAQLEYVLAGDHTFKLNATNDTSDVTTTVNGAAALSQTRNMLGAVYNGKFMDGKLLTVASYHNEDYVVTAGTKTKNSYAAIGGRYSFSAFDVEADYLSNMYDFNPQAAANILATNSAYALVRYNLADIGSVSGKYEYSEQKVATSATADTKNKITGMTAAFEYKPVKEENWRAHVAVTQKDTKPETGDTKSERMVIVGMRVYADLLK